MSSKFKQLAAEQRQTQGRVGIPQIDPGEAGKVEIGQQVQASPTPGGEQQAVTLTEAQPSSSSPPTAPADPRILEVNGETPIKMGWHMYPTRHRQVVYEAFMLGVKPWEVNETALAEYFERRYGRPSSPRDEA